MEIDDAVHTLIRLLRGIAKGSYNSDRIGYKLTINRYRYGYKPYWASDEYVPSNLATYYIWYKTKHWYGSRWHLAGKIEYDDRTFFGSRANNKDERLFKNADHFVNGVECLVSNTIEY